MRSFAMFDSFMMRDVEARDEVHRTRLNRKTPEPHIENAKTTSIKKAEDGAGSFLSSTTTKLYPFIELLDWQLLVANL